MKTIDTDKKGGKVLVFCPIGLGNFIMASPAFRHLRNSYNQGEVHILALKPGIKQMAEESGWFDSVHFWDPDSDTVKNGFKILLKLRQLHFDYSISLFPTGHWKFCVFQRFIAAKMRFGFHYPHTPVPSVIQHFSIPAVVGSHDTEQNMEFLATILNRPAPSFFGLSFPLKIDDKIKIPHETFFICHPGSSAERGMLKKRLPAEKYAALINLIYSRFNVKCILVGGPEEKPLRDSITLNAREALIEMPTKNLNELGTVISRGCFFLGNDSGIMHMAVAMGKQCIVFFGPSDEERTGPYYLSTKVSRTTESSRGHLIIREINRTSAPNGPKSKVTSNPKLKFAADDSLRILSVEKAWEKIEPYIHSLLQ
ncbi:MAG: glycosyltransferase family 9 protein [Fibrobacteria bacterium]|nr:glycosyltransferase family 9 protein [Fibrobacteria bacterium]